LGEQVNREKKMGEYFAERMTLLGPAGDGFSKIPAGEL
jgi:hypothetical protein